MLKIHFVVQVRKGLTIQQTIAIGIPVFTVMMYYGLIAVNGKRIMTTLIVSQTDAGQYQTISDAIRVASVGTRIIVQPGMYPENLIIDKPLQIIGEGPVEEIVVESTNTSCLTMKSDYAKVSGLTLRSRRHRKRGKFFTVDIPRAVATGRLHNYLRFAPICCNLRRKIFCAF